MSQPWMKFYPADWRSEPSLRFTSLAARGLWIEMLALMHEADQRGSLVVKGKVVTNAMLAAMVGTDEQTVANLVSELEENGVFSRKRNGVIFSRRMERDEIKARKNRDNGLKGGNPSLCKDTENEQSVNPTVKAKKPDTRSQIPDNVSSNEDTKPRDALAMLSEVLDLPRSKAVLQHRRSKKLAVTEHAIGLLVGNLKACPDPNAAADEMILRGWTSVKAEWLERDKPRQQAPPKTAHQQRRAQAFDAFNEILGVKQDDGFDGRTIELKANGANW